MRQTWPTEVQFSYYPAQVNLRVLAGVAKPNPKMGQALGPLGINMMKFCEEFNKVTTHVRPDVPLKVRLTAFTDRTFKFIVKPPETTWFLKKAAGKDKFTPLPAHFIFTPIPVQYIYEIAKVKKEMDPDLKNQDVAIIMTVPMASP